MESKLIDVLIQDCVSIMLFYLLDYDIDSRACINC